MKVSSVAEMRQMDKTAIEKYGIPDALLMENAGEAAYSVLSDKIGIQGKRVVIFCGAGNNGGDGFVIARKIFSNGGQVKVFILTHPDKYRGSARLNLDIIHNLPIEVRQIGTPDEVRADVMHCHAVVDAIFGTGLTRDVTGLYAEVIELMNSSGKTLLSADIPSGVHGDTGKIMGAAVKADFTVTFGLPKYGNMLYPGYDFCGELFVTYISFPPSLYDSEDLRVEINRPRELPPRRKDGHKGSFGDVLFIAGASGYFGAPYFAAQSFLRAGGGYSRLAAPASMIPHIANKGREIVFIPQQETVTGSIALENKAFLLALSEKVDMVVMGPGLSLTEETQQLVRELTTEIEKPLIVDGDGITALCQDLQLVRDRKAETILTPHPGEMSRMTGINSEAINSNRIGILQKTSKDLRATVVLKGAHTLIGMRDERVFLNTTGNSGMATAGSGDVLAGTIAAMYGLGLPVQEAVRKGVYIHGLSGDLAAAEAGEDGMTAQDILAYLPRAMKMDREGLDKTYAYRYAGPQII